MDKELLTTLGLDPDKELKGLLEDLEGKQYEFFERLETTNDESRREELNSLLSRIDQTIGEIKNQIASVDSAIILDMGMPVAEEAPKQEQKEIQKEKEAELASKVQALKEKDVQKQQEQQTAVAVQEPQAAPAQQPASDLQRGLALYHKQDYNGAFPVFKQLAEHDDATAQYMLACMYNRGEGTDMDHGRAEFWMKKAADNGDKIAQFDYAVFQLSDCDNDKTKIATGIRYLKSAADQEHQDAMERFVDLIYKDSVNISEMKAACGYCEKLLLVTEDSYEKQKYSEIRQQLRARQRNIRRRHFGAAASSVVSTVGALILIVPTLWMFASFHQDFLRTIPFIAKLPGQVLDILFGFGYESEYFLETMALVGIGWCLKGAGCKDTRNMLATVVVYIGCTIRYVAILGHIGLGSYLEMDILADAMYNLGGVAVMIVGGRIVGLILSLILGTRAGKK